MSTMQSSLSPDIWLELAFFLGVGVTVVFGLAALAERLLRSAVWQRTVWRVAGLAMAGLMLVELTGSGAAVARRVSFRRDHSSGVQNSVPVSPTPPRASEPADDKLEPFGQGLTGLRDEATTANGGAGRYAGRRYGEGFFEPPIPQRGGVSVDSEPQRETTPLIGATAWRPATTPVATAPLVQPGYARWPGWIWLLGSAILAGYAVSLRVLLVIFLRRHARTVGDETLCGLLARLAGRMGVRRRVRLVEAWRMTAPAAFGIFRPTIALPATFSEDFDPLEQQAMLAHEVAHLAARDPFWQLATDLLAALLWWHPLVWWSRRRLRATSEAAADEASLLVPEGPQALASCLVAMGRRLTETSPRRLGWLSVEGADFRSDLGRRVQRLLSIRKRSWRTVSDASSLVAITTLPVTLVAVAISCTAWGRPQATFPEGETTMDVLRKSWRRSLAAAAVVPLLTMFSGDPPANAAEDDEPRRAVARDDDSPEARRERREDREREKGEARERREARERPRHAEELEREFGRLRERAQQIERELKELGDRQEAQELRGELREIEQRMEEIRRELGGPEREGHQAREGQRRGPESPELAQRRRELEERAGNIRRELGELRDGQDDEARELQAALREVEEQLRGLEAPRRGPEREREDVHRRFEELKRARQEALEAGRGEDAERIGREMEEIARRPEGGRRAEVPPPGQGEIEELRVTVRQLRGEVREMQEQIEDMRRLLKALVDREEDEREDEREDRDK